MKDGVSPRLGHDATSPAIDRGRGKGGVTEVTSTAGDDRFEQGSRLRPGLDPVLQCGRNRQPLSLRRAVRRQAQQQKDQYFPMHWTRHADLSPIRKRDGPDPPCWPGGPKWTSSTVYPAIGRRSQIRGLNVESGRLVARGEVL